MRQHASGHSRFHIVFPRVVPAALQVHRSLVALLCEVQHSKAYSCFLVLNRGTRDGWRAEDFHRLCDSQGETLTVIKSPDDCLFGGYADQPWQRRDAPVKSSKAFLFTLTGEYGSSRMNLISKKARNHAIQHKVDGGLSFGGEHGLEVYYGENGRGPGYVTFQVCTANRMHTHLWGQAGFSQVTYYLPSDKFGALVFPARKKVFTPVELEVYQVIRAHAEAPSVSKVEPLEAVGGHLNEALAESLLASIKNEKIALRQAVKDMRNAQAAFLDEPNFVTPFLDKGEDVVRLNVLGSPIDVSLGVVRSHEESMLATILDENKWQAQPQNLDEDGRYLLVSRDEKMKDLGIKPTHTDALTISPTRTHTHTHTLLPYTGGLALRLPQADRCPPPAQDI